MEAPHEVARGDNVHHDLSQDLLKVERNKQYLTKFQGQKPPPFHTQT